MADHSGHRKRIIAKLDRNVLLEHELLEIFLFNAIPRRNTNDIAHRLLNRFKSIRGVFEASVSELKTVEGVGENVAAYLVTAGAFFKKYYEMENMSLPEYFETNGFSEFVQKEYMRKSYEVLDFYLLDASRKIIAIKHFSKNEARSVQVSPVEVSRMFIEHKPSGVVAVHNHPFGISMPSEADDQTTVQLQMIASFHNVLFCDHFICGTDGVYSYYLNGKMQKISEKYAIGKLAELKGWMNYNE